MESLDAAVKKIVKGAGISFIGKVASTGFKCLTQVILAWLLGAELFGLYTLGIVLYQFGELFSRMGLERGRYAMSPSTIVQKMQVVSKGFYCTHWGYLFSVA